MTTTSVITFAVEMSKDKETKGAVRYAAETPDGADVLPTLYVRKDAFSEGDIPSRITVTVVA